MLTDDQIHYIQKRIRSYALKLKRLYAFQEEAVEDLQQDLWADLLAALHSYDPQKGIWSHFVENVLRKRYCTMLKNRFRLKRPTRLRKISLDAGDGVSAHVPAHLPLDVDLLHDRLFLQKQIRKMPRPLRTVFEQAQLYSFRQIAKNLSIPRHELRKLVDYGTAYLRAMQERPARADSHADAGFFREAPMRIPLAYLDEAPLREIADLPLNELTELMQRLKEACDTQDRRKKVLNAALKMRFGGVAADLLRQEGKDTGTVRFREAQALIVAQLRKKVEWDQNTLRAIWDQHPELHPVIKCSYAIEEKHYATAPKEIQALLAPARSVKVAGYDFTIEEEHV